MSPELINRGPCLVRVMRAISGGGLSFVQFWRRTAAMLPTLPAQPVREGRGLVSTVRVAPTDDPDTSWMPACCPVKREFCSRSAWQGTSFASLLKGTQSAHSVLHFWNSVQAPHKIFLNLNSKSKWSPKFNKVLFFFKTKVPQFFPLTQSEFGPDPKFSKRFTVRLQSKNKYVRVRIQSNAHLC